MPKVSVYLPDELYQRARGAGLSVSTVAQTALREALDRTSNDQWFADARARTPRTSRRIDTTTLLGDVRDEFGA